MPGLLPTWLGPRTGDDERAPDLNVLPYNHVVAEMGAQQPFLSIAPIEPSRRAG